jgi:peptidoglycan/LPS O-acetylase OafA/YrhL
VDVYKKQRKNKPLQLDQITFTRFIAALSVVFFHYGMDIFPANIPYLQELVTAGPIAVNYFYILSGFIMAIAYYRPQEQAGFNKWTYWLARFARIYPVYLVALLLIAVVKYKTLSDDVFTLPLHLTMLQAWLPSYPMMLNTPGWSLSVEAFFYLCFPFLLLGVYKYGTYRFIIFAVALWIATQVIVLVLHNSEYYAVKSLLHDFLFYNPIMHLNAFIAGFLTGIFFKEKKRKPLRYNTFWLLVSVALIALLLIYRPIIENIIGIQIAYTNGLIAPVFLLFIVLLAQETGLIASILSHKWLVLLGEASFSLYILQKPLHGVYDKLIINKITLPEIVHFYIFLILLILVSILSYKYFETPARKFINQRYRS